MGIRLGWGLGWGIRLDLGLGSLAFGWSCLGTWSGRIVGREAGSIGCLVGIVAEDIVGTVVVGIGGIAVVVGDTVGTVVEGIGVVGTVVVEDTGGIAVAVEDIVGIVAEDIVVVGIG